MKAKTLALSMALLMMVAVLFAVPMVSAGTDPVVYDPTVILNTDAGSIGFVNNTIVSGKTQEDTVFGGAYSVVGYGAGTSYVGQTFTDTKTVEMNRLVTSSSQIQFLHKAYTRPGATTPTKQTGDAAGSVRIAQKNKTNGTYTMVWVCGQKWHVQEPILLFTAPNDGVYDITTADHCKTVALTKTADIIDARKDTPIYFTVEKFAAGTVGFAQANGEVLDTVTLTKEQNSFAFPTKTGVVLRQGEIIAFRLKTTEMGSSDKNFGTTTEAAPIVTRTGDIPKDIEVEEPELILEPIVYNPITSLNAAAGDYGLGGSACVADTYGTATFDDVFTATAKEGGDWKMGSYAPEKPLNTVWVRGTNHLRLYPGQYCIHDGTPYSSNYGNIEIYQYNNGYQVMWWTPGGNYDYKVAEVAFTAAYDGVYDITAPAGFDTVSRTPAAIRDGSAVADKEITFAIVKGDETLNSVTVKGDESKPFPAVNGVKLKAGDQVFFRVSTNFIGSSTQYGLAIEANPIITRRADAPMAPFDNATAGILDMAELPEGKQGLRFTQELTTTDGEAGEVLVLGDKVFDVKFIGMLAAVKANLGEDELTLDTTATNAAIQNSAVTSYRAKKENGNTNVYTFSALITNIAAANKAVSVSVRAYLVCEDAEGNEYVFYGKTLTSSVLNVYNYAKNAGHDFYDTVDAWMA